MEHNIAESYSTAMTQSAVSKTIKNTIRSLLDLCPINIPQIIFHFVRNVPILTCIAGDIVEASNGRKASFNWLLIEARSTDL